MQDSPPRHKRFPRRNGWGALLLSFAAVAALVWWSLPAKRNQPQPADQEAATQPRLTSQATLSAGVVQLMVTGNAAVARGGADDLRRARSAFEQAIERDERYAPAHAGLAQALVQLAAGGAERAEQVLPLAVTHADRAIELDPAEALGWQALAQAEVQWTRDWPRAEMHYRRAVALAPRTEAPARLLAELLVATRRGEEAVAQGLSALELNPTSPALQEAIGLIYRFAGRGAEALPFFGKALELDPQGSTTVVWQAVTLADLGRLDEAMAAALRVPADAGTPTWVVGYVHALAGRRREAADVFNGLAVRATRQYVPAVQFAYLSAALGERGQALDWIETGVREHSPWMHMLAVDPSLGRLRGEPRFKAALTAMKLDGER